MTIMYGWKYILVPVILLAAELLYFRVAERFRIVDRPNPWSSHTKEALRGGGVIFVVAVWVWAALFGPGYPWFLAGLTLIAGISFADDIHSLPNSVRLAVQFAAMLLMFRQLGILSRDLWWALAVAWVACVGILNAYNFMDGINGITGAYSLAVLLPLLYLDRGGAVFVDASLLRVMLLAVLIFCWFNFRPKNRARCFAGDVGSVGIAFVLVFALGSLILRTRDFSYVMFLAVYGVDVVLTIVHRILLHEPLGEAHRKHAYQLLANELGWSHRAVSLLYMGLQLAISAGLVLLPLDHGLYAAAVLVLLCGAYVAFMRKYYPLHAAYLASLGEASPARERKR